MSTTVIITAYKEPKTLYKQLKTVTNQTRLSDEIIVCAPDSLTQRVVLEYQKNHPNVKLIKDQGIGKPAALNLALQEASGEILVLTDGDVEICGNSLAALLKYFKNPRVGAVSGRPINTNAHTNKFGFWAYVLTEMAHKTRVSRRKKGEYVDCSGYLYAIRAGLVKNIPENTLSDDALISRLIYNLGHEITYAPEAKVNVKYPDNFRDWLKQKKRSTGGYAQNFPPARPVRQSVSGGGGGIKGGGRNGKMRGFRQEIAGIFQIFKYAKTPREFYWTILLIFARIILWLAIFWEIKIIKKPFAKIWQRVESTKNLP